MISIAVPEIFRHTGLGYILVMLNDQTFQGPCPIRRERQNWLAVQFPKTASAIHKRTAIAAQGNNFASVPGGCRCELGYEFPDDVLECHQTLDLAALIDYQTQAPPLFLEALRLRTNTRE